MIGAWWAGGRGEVIGHVWDKGFGGRRGWGGDILEMNGFVLGTKLKYLNLDSLYLEIGCIETRFACI